MCVGKWDMGRFFSFMAKVGACRILFCSSYQLTFIISTSFAFVKGHCEGNVKNVLKTSPGFSHAASVQELQMR